MLERIRWLGHASFLISGEPRVYIDPWNLTTTEEAAEAANTFRPRVAIPYHWGDIVGTRQDAERFAQSFTGETRILDEDGQP
ncbi:MAG: hypothetical protein O7B80_06760 [bacterium]|jgi:L-ascorbate metabolism protein UlaG (beta-lactamase superfamily)|nr:hypothetical protein [bacterium]MDV2479616.1 hypothetical protein [bacterium]